MHIQESLKLNSKVEGKHFVCSKPLLEVVQKRQNEIDYPIQSHSTR